MKTNMSRAGSVAALVSIVLSGATFSAEKPSDLHKQFETAQAEFYSLYNTLNTDRQYDMVCKMGVQTGTRMAKRVCLPRFY